MKACEIWSSTKKGKEKVGEFHLENGQIVSYPNTENDKIAMNLILERFVIGKQGKKFFPDKDPQGWLDNLPVEYNSAYLWAEPTTRPANEVTVGGLIIRRGYPNAG